MIVLGYPAAAPGPRPMREKNEMVHHDRERFREAPRLSGGELHYCGPEAFRTDEEVNGFIERSR